LIAYRRPLRRLIQALAGLGLFASIIFELVQIFIIQALCVYCAVSALLALLIFVFAFFIESVRPAYPALPPPTAV
ncbi:MAG: vitamin K epoxide reductase family protein, partial [Minisyncoccia bacterium]